jgi:hypothetical protein
MRAALMCVVVWTCAAGSARADELRRDIDWTPAPPSHRAHLPHRAHADLPAGKHMGRDGGLRVVDFTGQSSTAANDGCEWMRRVDDLHRNIDWSN